MIVEGASPTLGRIEVGGVVQWAADPFRVARLAKRDARSEADAPATAR